MNQPLAPGGLAVGGRSRKEFSENLRHTHQVAIVLTGRGRL
jgi:hypothetical protein